jgi:hypothetical protein
MWPGAPPFRDSVIGLDISPEEYHITDRSAATGFCAPLNLRVPRPSRSLRRVGGVGGMTRGLGYRCYQGGGESAARCRLGGVGWTKPEKQGKSPPFAKRAKSGAPANSTACARPSCDGQVKVGAPGQSSLWVEGTKKQTRSAKRAAQSKEKRPRFMAERDLLRLTYGTRYRRGCNPRLQAVKWCQSYR